MTLALIRGYEKTRGISKIGGTLIDTALLIARLLLTLVFALAGLAKLADHKGSRQAIVDFGLPPSLAPSLGIFLPLCELAVAAALIPTATAWWGAIGALALLVLFIVGIGTNLARGRRPDCHCFGQLHSSPAGWNTLLRNGVLAAVAAFVVWEGKEGAGPSAVSWLGTLSAAQLVGLIVGLIVLGLLVGTWWFLVYLLRQNGRLLVRLDALEARLDAAGVAPSPNEAQQAGLPVGTEAPDFSLQGLYGETLTLEALRAPDKPVMLLFTDPDCGPCNALLPEIGRWQQEHAEKLTISLLSRGSSEENRTKSTEHGVTNVVLQEDWEIYDKYQAADTPSAVLINPDGKIGSYVAGGAEAIEALVADALKPQVGDPAPEIKLPELSGETTELKDFEGEKTLVLFWNPGCGFCQQMLDDLKALESDPPEGAPKVLIVSAGTKEANEAMGLSSPVVLDQEFAVGRAFGAPGTPSGVLVDEEGKIASEVAVGTQAVLALAQDGQAQEV